MVKIEKAGYKPDTIIALARSGFVPGRILSDFMGVTNLVGLKVEHWLDTTGQHKEEAKIPYKVPFKIKEHKVLVIDDIVDTGKSMSVAVNYIKIFRPAQVKVAVMQYILTSEFIPDYYAVKIKEWTWFIYPWNIIEDLCNLAVRLIKAEPSLSKNLNKLDLKFKEKYELNIESQLMKVITSTLIKRAKIVKMGKGCKLI